MAGVTTTAPYTPRSKVKRTSISGVELVTLPLFHYKDLLEAQRRLEEIQASAIQLHTPQRGLLNRNPEVAVYLAQNFGLVPIPTLLRRCKRLFGAARTPSASAAYRYWERIRIEARKSKFSAAK